MPSSTTQPRRHLVAARAIQPLRTAQGQAMIEYIIVAGVLTAALFVPVPIADNMSVADYLARAVRSFFRAYSFLVSVN